MNVLAQGDRARFAVTFSYADLDPKAAEVAKTAADAVRGLHKDFIPEVGRHLLRAKEVLPHGAFTAWVQRELDITARTARNYMAVAQLLKAKPETFSVLPPTILYALASPAAPKELVQDVLNEAGVGSSFNVPAIRAKLEAARAALETARNERAELKRAQRRSPTMTQADLRSRKAQQHKKDAAERARRDAEDEREKRDRHDRLTPLAQQVVGLCPELAAALLPVLTHYEDARILTGLLRDLLNGAANPTVQS